MQRHNQVGFFAFNYMMVAENGNFKILIEKLDAFIRKFYKNQLIKGALYFSALFLAFGLTASILEFYGHFGTEVRGIVFYSFLIVNCLVLTRLVVIPIFRLYKLGKVISYEQASAILGSHFPAVQDKIVNTLQLRHSLHHKNTWSDSERELIVAGINQKIADLNPIPFSTAIDFSENRKYIKFVLFPVSILLIMLFLFPGMLTESSARLIDHNVFYARPAPFSFRLVNKKLICQQQKDFLVDLKMAGSVLPATAFIEIEGIQYQMEALKKDNFRYLIRNLQKPTQFRFFAEGFYSPVYNLMVYLNPLVLNFSVHLQYPDYTGKKSETLQNIGDLILPAGTVGTWIFDTENTNKLSVQFKESGLLQLAPSVNNAFSFSRKWFKSDSYSIKASNKNYAGGDSIVYSVAVVADAFPTITVLSSTDSTNHNVIYFKGQVKDDYGFDKLRFVAQTIRKNSVNSADAGIKEKIEMLPVSKNGNQDGFFYTLDLTAYDLHADDVLDYFFEVWDNDRVTGSKAAKSQVFVVKQPGLKEQADAAEKSSNHIKEELSVSLKAAKQFQKEVVAVNKKLFDKKELGWEDKKTIEGLMKKQQQLEQRLNALQQENKKNNAEKNSAPPNSQSVLEKQQKLNDIMEKLLSEEMRKIMDELKSLLEKSDKAQLQEQLEKLKNGSKDLEKELDRSLAIFKQLEFQEKMKEAIGNLDKLAAKQDALAKESEQGKDSQGLTKKQALMKEDFEQVKRDLEALEKKNEALEFKEDFKNPSSDEKSIEKEMSESEKALSEGKNKKAAQSQKNAGTKMAQLSDKLKKMESDSEEQKAEEDMNTLRGILENLLRLSFNEEQLINDVKSIGINDPKYLKISKQQRFLKDDAKLIEDSLLALSKRVVEIKSIVNKEIAVINQQVAASIEHLEERQTEQARSNEQYVMTSVNNLALLLGEILDGMQQQMAKAKSGEKQKPGGKSSCKKPGSGSPTMSSLRKLQEQLNKQLKEAKEGLEKQGAGKSGQMSSEQVARLAAQQALIRNEIEKMRNAENNKSNNSLGSQNKILNQMEQTETDLVNKVLNQEVLNRQQEILGRLLESEKAEKEREQDSKRTSNEAKALIRQDSPQFVEYKKQKLKEMELLRSVPPSFNPFYKKIVNNYFERIQD